MHITKALTAPNGAGVTHHKTVSLLQEHEDDSLRALIHSWPDAAAQAGGYEPQWREHALVPLSALDLSGGLLAAVGAYLTTFGTLAGGTVIPPEVATLEDAKLQRWAALKIEREQRIQGAGTTPWGTFDASPAAIANITSVAAVLLANPALAEVQFTLADNTRPTFARADFLAAASTVAAAVQAIHDTAHTLRGQIDAAQTVAAVQAVVWPG